MSDYSARQIEAARRVLVDVDQVLAAFEDAIVIVGGCVPDLLLPHAEPEHIGSIDVDLALDAPRLGDGRRAEILKLLLDTSRYRQGEKDFQLVADVDFKDGEPPVRVDVESLASSLMKPKKNRPKLIEDFRVLPFPACAVAFKSPEEIEIKGLHDLRRGKLASVEQYGPQQLADFHDPTNAEEHAMHARRAYELVQKLLNLL